MPDIATINGIAEDNIATYNGATASTVTGVLGNTWVHFSTLVASGGTITTSGDYKYHTFTSSSQSPFTVSDVGSGASIDYLVVADGGAPLGTGNAGGFTPVEGYNGAGSASSRSGGGGGGASEVGGTYSTGVGGVGGDGLAWLNGTTYAGGGGGGAYSGYTGGRAAGGSGGGGAGGDWNTSTRNAIAGLANTGGGGGAAGSNLGYGGAGGSGIVIVRYQYQE